MSKDINNASYNQNFVTMKKHNFSAGPSILPREVIEETAKGVLDFNGSGLSVIAEYP